MSPSNPVSPNPLPADLADSLHRLVRGGARRVAALAGLTIRETVRSRALLGMTILMALFGAGSLLWPADVDAERVILVQRRCFDALTFFGLIAASFLAGSAIPADLSSKRIYSIAAKPVTRLEFLLGKTLGLVGVIFIFLAAGAIITIAVTHLASARKSYPGRSYTLEVTAPTAEIRTNGGTVTVNRGQIFTADGKADDRYLVTIADRDTQVTGTIPESAVQLHVRSLEPRRVVRPASSSAFSKGKARITQNELWLAADELARNDKWDFPLPADIAALEGRKGGVPVRMRFARFRHEPPAVAYEQDATGASAARLDPRKALVKLLFRSPAVQEPFLKEIEFANRLNDNASASGGDPFSSHYEEIFALPKNLLAAGRLQIEVIDYSPTYPQTGSVYFGSTKSPVWLFRDLDPRLLPAGDQTIRAWFSIHYTRGMELIDAADVTAEIRNPATGETISTPLKLRDRTETFIRFPRRLIDDQNGVQLAFTGIGEAYQIGHTTREAPVYLMLKPDRFWATTARSVFLIFLNLALFTVLAAAASTFLSAPVAILLVMVAALAGVVKDLMFQAPMAAPQAAITLQETVWLWIKYLLTQALVLAPGFDRFSSADYVTRGWAVPWSAVWQALPATLAYGAVIFGLGYLAFRKREFE